MYSKNKNLEVGQQFYPLKRFFHKEDIRQLHGMSKTSEGSSKFYGQIFRVFIELAFAVVTMPSK